MNYWWRWLVVMYDRHSYRKSREFAIEKQCAALERRMVRSRT